MKILITGGPKTGKTTLARELAQKYKLPTGHTDDLVLKYSWEKESEVVRDWIDVKEDNLIEGTTVPRALRKWLKENPKGKPADIVYYLKEPKVSISKGQVTMTKGIDTVWREILPELKKRGVTVV